MRTGGRAGRSRPSALGCRHLGLGLWVRRRLGLARVATACAVCGLTAAALGVNQLGRIVWVLGGVLGILVATCLRLGPRRSDALPILMLTGAAAAGLLWGAARTHAVTEGPLASMADIPQASYVVKLDQSLERHGVAWSGPGRILGVRLPGEEGRLYTLRQCVWIELFQDKRSQIGTTSAPADLDEAPPILQAGSTLVLPARIREPTSAVRGFDQSAYLRSRGIGWVLSGNLVDVTWLIRQVGPTTWFADLRSKLCRLLASGVPAAHGSLMQGILLGIKDGIPRDVSDSFRRSGLSHMLTVSGSHIAWLIAGVLALAKLMRLPRWAGLAAAALMLVVFVPLTDGGPSVLRAALTGSLVIVARLLGRGRDPFQLLLLAALCLIAFNPYVATSPGMQLSFTAVLGILCLASRIERALHRVPSVLAQITAVTLAATIGTAPVSLARFGEIPLGSLPANLLATPVMPLVTGLGLVSCLAGLAWTPAAVFLNQPAAVLVEWSMCVAGWCSRLPVLPRSSAGLVVCAAAGVGAAWTLIEVRGRRSGRGRFSGAPARRRALLVVGGLLGACLYVPGAWAVDQVTVAWAGRAWPPHGEVRILDVGQGSAALIRTPGRRAVLVDAGSAGHALGTKLRALGVRHLDLVLISHPHEDHFGGLADLAGVVTIGWLVDGPSATKANSAVSRSSSPPFDSEREAYQRLRCALEEAGARCVQLADDWSECIDGCGLLVEVPEERWLHTGDDNDASLVVRVAVGPIDILLPGDAEARALEEGQPTEVDVLVVGHHGSRGSVSVGLLRHLKPALAVISVGKGNSFGHPHVETTDCLDGAGVPYLRTDVVGGVALTPTGRGEEISVCVEREAVAEGVRRR